MCGSIMEDIADTVEHVATGGLDTVVEAVNNLPEVGETVGNVLGSDFVSTIAENVADIGANLIGGPLGAVTGAVAEIGEFAGELASGEGLAGDENIMSGIDEAVGGLASGDGFGGIFEALGKTGQGMQNGEAVAGAIGEVAETIGQSIGQIIDQVETIGQVFEGVDLSENPGGGAIGDLMQSLGEQLGELPGAGAGIDFTDMTPQATEFVPF